MTENTVITEEEMTEYTEIHNEMDREELLEFMYNQELKIAELTKKLETKGTGRKEAVLKLLMDGATSIKEIAEEIGITNKNVSSQLTYLRADGHQIISYRLGGQSHLELR